MILAVELLKEGGLGSLALGVDNQAAIVATGALCEARAWRGQFSNLSPPKIS